MTKILLILFFFDEANKMGKAKRLGSQILKGGFIIFYESIECALFVKMRQTGSFILYLKCKMRQFLVDMELNFSEIKNVIDEIL